MRYLLPLPLVFTSILAWDCKDAINNSSINHDTFCRGYTSAVTIYHYDKFSIESGVRIATASASDIKIIVDIVKEEADQCYHTCMLANMY